MAEPQMLHDIVAGGDRTHTGSVRRSGRAPNRDRCRCSEPSVIGRRLRGAPCRSVRRGAGDHRSRSRPRPRSGRSEEGFMGGSGSRPPVPPTLRALPAVNVLAAALEARRCRAPRDRGRAPHAAAIDQHRDDVARRLEEPGERSRCCTEPLELARGDCKPGAAPRDSMPPGSSCTPTSAERHSPLAARDAVAGAAAEGYTNLELDLETGGPGRRATITCASGCCAS